MFNFLIHPVSGVFFGALIISFSGVFVALSQVHPMVSAFYRVFFGCFFMVLACVMRKEFNIQPLKHNLLAMACGLVFALDLLFWHFSIAYIGPGLATILSNCQVFILAVAGWLFYKERLNGLFILSLPLALAGLYMIIGLDGVALSSRYLAGIGFGLLTALCYGVFLLLIRHVQSKGPGTLFYYQIIVTGSASVFLGLVILVSGHSFAIPGWESLAALLGLGGVSQALAWAVIAYSLPGVDASRAGLILLLQPALSFVWDVLFFNRATGGMGWLGVAVVLAAIYMGMSRRK